MSGTLYLHHLANPTVDHQPNISSLTLDFGGGSAVCLFLPRHVAEAMAAAFNAASVPGYDALLGFIEELRDHKPEVISGRRRDPQDDQDDLMHLPEFEAFQADAEKLTGKRKKVTA